MSRGGSTGPAGYSTQARREARQILSQPPYTHRSSHSAAPLAGVLHAIGHGLWWLIGRPLAWLWRHAFAHAVNRIHLALGPWWPLPVAVAFVALGFFAGWLLARRRSRIAAAVPAASSEAETEDAAALERAAVEAERQGDLESAVRLRYRAGLNRLEARGIISSRLTRTDGQLRLVVRDAIFDDLTYRHESVAYGRQEATPQDVAAAKEGWPKILSGTAQGSGGFDEEVSS